MSRLRYLTAGESHGPALLGILEGLPAGLPLGTEELNRDLARRQKGHGRGGRMKIEQDAVELLSGVRFGRTLGSPLGLSLRNRDFASWTERMQAAPGGPDARPVLVPRPGHADLAGGLKYGQTGDLRDVLERASARETAIRVALGAAARALLRELGVQIGSYVRAIGGVEAVSASVAEPVLAREDAEGLALLADLSEVRALDAASTTALVQAIDDARAHRDTVGGVIEVIVTGLPVGLGSHVQWDRKLDGRLAQALLSIPAIKALELGDGWAAAGLRGSQVHDPILLERGRLSRGGNRAGGLEGGISNGEPLVIRLAMKPISTVPAALPSVQLATLAATPAHVERSDTCAVPAAGVVAEAMVALVLADAVLEALGGDTLESLRLPFARLRCAARVDPGHVFLVGPMGAGKSTTGLTLAARMSLPFVELDGRIVTAAGLSIPELFRERGEATFRELEAAALEEVCAEAPAVVALGGGAALGEPAWRLLRRSGVTLLLDAPPAELLRRLASSGRPLEDRPLLSGGDPLALLTALCAARARWYDRADVRLQTTGLDPTAAAGAALGLLLAVRGPLGRGGGGAALPGGGAPG